MAKLSAFKLNAAAISDGEWITVGVGADTFEIKTRGFTSRYRDALNSLRRDAARKANRGLVPGATPFTPDSLPPTLDDLCQGEALAQYCVLDVRGLQQDDGTPVSIEDFRQMLTDRDSYVSLLVLALNAASSVGQARTEEAQAAAKNSGTGFAGT